MREREVKVNGVKEDKNWGKVDKKKIEMKDGTDKREGVRSGRE